MPGSYSGVVILLLLGASVSVSSTADVAKSLRAAKARLRSSYASWRIVVCLTQPQTPFKTDVQRAWEEARLESFHADMDVSYIEARMTPMTDSLSYPLSLLNKFCTDIEGGKTVLSLIIGGGSAARFLVTAAAALNLPALWLPFTHRDFLRQGNLGRFENRIGSSPKEIGAAAAALMHRANWHAFTLLIDTTLLPITHLLRTSQPTLTPRAIIHLPTNDRTLRLRLRRVAEEGGSGGIVVMACDLSNARKILGAAGKFEMLSGRFLWLWLDLKAELRPNEPNIISSVIPGTRAAAAAAAAATNENLPLLERTINLASTNDERPPPLMSSLPSLANDIHRLQEYRWQNEKIVTKREDRGFNFDDEEDARLVSDRELNSKNFMPVGMLALRPSGIKIMGGDTILSRMLRETSQALDETFQETKQRLGRMREPQLREHFVPECFPDRNAKFMTSDARENVSAILTSKLRRSVRQISKDKAEFQLLNLQAVRFPGNKTQLRWTKVGTIKGGREVRLDTIIWPGGGIVPAYLEQGGEKIGMPIYRIVTAIASPFTMVTSPQEGFCLRGLTCQQGDAMMCCYGLSMDLLTVVARELGFRFNLYLAEDGLFGKRNGRSGAWSGVMGELVSGRAQLAFAPLSVSTHRAEVVDFTTPYYFSGVSFLTAPKLRSEIPLFAFLFPFSTELWIAVFTSLNFTAIAVALYEWFSPFGLNPWGRQRSKNFSIASALWVMWGLLCGHLVAFKAPKSWPNKFLINIWGGFSVIFVASYTANIAALIAGLFFHSVSNYHDKSLLSQRVAAPRASAAEYYVQRANPQLWSHMARYSLSDVAEGVERLRNGSLDILIADTPILDYYRGTDDGCRLQKIGDTINEDTYAIALTKGHPLKESISKVIANYTSNGLLDILQEKWYGGLPCLGSRQGMDAGLDSESGQPRPLGVASVAGVFCLLGMGVVLGTIILAGEHLFYKYTLPRLRHRPEDSIWRSRNVMFFSQKLYRFINCVELVSPHHAARELVHTVRQGQIASLFQKSVKRKEHEQRRRRKSKAQFFEMIQEIRRVQQEEKIETVPEEPTEATKKDEKLGKGRERSRSKSPLMPRSPKRSEKSRSSTNLSASRLGLSPVSLDAPMKPREFTLSSTNLRARSPLETVGRRLSHGDGGSPPPRLGSHFGGSATLRPLAPTRSDSTGGGTPTVRRDSAAAGGGGAPTPRYSRSPAKRGQSFPVFATLRPPHSAGYQTSKSPLLSPNSELTSAIGRKLSREWGSGTINLTRSSEAIGGGNGASGGDGSGRSGGGGSTYTLNQEMTLSLSRSADEKKAQEEALPIKKPIRRARSHENRDSGKLMVDLPSPRLTQPVVGGRSVSERTKKQLESELKAILSARAHHRDLHPP